MSEETEWDGRFIICLVIICVLAISTITIYWNRQFHINIYNFDKSQIDQMRKANLVGYLASIKHSEVYCVQGLIINYGYTTAANVILKLAWLGETETHNETLSLANINKLSYVAINETYEFTATGDIEFQYSIDWS